MTTAHDNTPTVADANLFAGRIQALTDLGVGGDPIHQEADDGDHEAPRPFAELPSERSARVGDVAGEFASIRVSYRPQNGMTGSLHECLHTALSIREQRAATGNRIPMNVMRTIAEMGVGKTWAAEKLEAICNPADPDDPSRPVLLVTLDTSGKQDSLPRGILRTLKVRGWNHGNDAQILWARAIEAMKDHGVQLLIFDEINRAARRPSIGPVIGGDIMDLLLNGDVGVAFLGTDEALSIFNRCPPLKDRMKAPVVMKALDWLIPDERETFQDFLAKMDQALFNRGLTTALAGLADDAIAKPLWDVCLGRLRPLCLLLEEAVTSLHRGGGGAGPLTVEILAQAVEDHSIFNEVVSYNPFTEEKPE